MIQWIKWNLNEIFFSVFLVGVCWLVYLMASSSHRLNQRLMSQCLADGRKEYECYAIVYKKSDTVIVPVHR